MPSLKPQTRFLLRGTALLISLLTLWWFLLLPPMLFALEGMAGIFLTINAPPAADWTLRVPLERTLPATDGRPAQQIHSIDFDLPRADVVSFTFSLPLFWAIILAAPNLAANVRTLLKGTAIMAALEVGLLLLLAQIVARKAVAELAGGATDFDKWLWRSGDYLITGVFPYILPIALALILHRQLREQILGLEPEPESPVPMPAAPPTGRRARKAVQSKSKL